MMLILFILSNFASNCFFQVKGSLSGRNDHKENWRINRCVVFKVPILPKQIWYFLWNADKLILMLKSAWLVEISHRYQLLKSVRIYCSYNEGILLGYVGVTLVVIPSLNKGSGEERRCRKVLYEGFNGSMK